MIELTSILNKLYRYYGYPIPEKIQIDVEKKIIKCKVNKNDYKLNDLKNTFLNMFEEYDCNKNQ